MDLCRFNRDSLIETYFIVIKSHNNRIGHKLYSIGCRLRFNGLPIVCTQSYL